MYQLEKRGFTAMYTGLHNCLNKSLWSNCPKPLSCFKWRKNQIYRPNPNDGRQTFQKIQWKGDQSYPMIWCFTFPSRVFKSYMYHANWSLVYSSWSIMTLLYNNLSERGRKRKEERTEEEKALTLLQLRQQPSCPKPIMAGQLKFSEDGCTNLPSTTL